MIRLASNLRTLYDKARLLVSEQRKPGFSTPTAPMNPPNLPIPLYLMSIEHQDELDVLLAPISAELPCGPALRYDPIFTDIRLAREEDDPSLPMGGWERPLKHADWAMIEARCKPMLATRSKDLQIGAWLMEAWTRQYGFEGLYRGISLVDRLVRQYWFPLHPVIDDDGDADARVAPLEWLNEAFSNTVRMHVALLKIPGRKPPGLTLVDWERMIATELATPAQPSSRPDAAGAEPSTTRADVINFAHQRLASGMRNKQQLIKRCINCLETMLNFVDLQLGVEAPNLSKLKGTLVAIERVMTQLTVEQNEEEMIVDNEDNKDVAAIAAAVAAPLAPGAPPMALTSGWNSRSEAYATLSALADYLSQIEPHSPTPYLLRRAVNWGRMPLPQLMAEIIREEGDLNRLINMLGLQE